MYSKFIIPFIAAVLTGAVVQALPDGAPVCDIGEAAPGSLHQSPFRQPETGSLAAGGFQVLLDDAALDPAVPKAVSANQDIQVRVTSLDGTKEFRGVLLILSQAGFSSTIGAFQLTTDEELAVQISGPCIDDGYAGITHVNNDLKSNVTASMIFDKNYGDLKFDVNIVVQNRGPGQGGSQYFHSQYSMKVEGGASSATAAPATAPTNLSCGLFGGGIFCPLTLCGFFGRLLLGSDRC